MHRDWTWEEERVANGEAMEEDNGGQVAGAGVAMEAVATTRGGGTSPTEDGDVVGVAGGRQRRVHTPSTYYLETMYV